MRKIFTSFLLTLLTLAFPAWGQVENPSSPVSINEAGVNITQPGTYTVTGTSTVTGNNITVNTNGTVNLTIENVNIESGGAPLNIEAGNVKLTLRGTNRLINIGWNNAGIRVPQVASLEITEESEGHSLTAQGSPNDWGGAGIGAGLNEIAGAITINGGNLDIIAGIGAAAIGGGTTYGTTDITPDATSITINGGTIKAQSKNYTYITPATIGGGSSFYNYIRGNGGVITITGGTVIANDIIGHKENAFTTSITITGGNISASCSITPTNGSTNLEMKEITGLTPYAKITALSGADGYSTEDMYADENGKLYLWLPSESNPSVSQSIAPIDNITITVNKDGAPWNNHGKTFSYKTADGEVMGLGFGKYYPEEGKEYIVYDGEYVTQAKVSKSNPSAMVNYYTVTYEGNGATGGTVPSGVYPSGTSGDKLPGAGSLVKAYYTFKGWGMAADAMESVGKSFQITQKTTLYAIWTRNEFTLMAQEIQPLTYGTAMESVDLSVWLSDNAEADCGTITFALKAGSTLPAGLTFSQEGILSGTPTAANEDGVTVTIVATAANGSTEEMTVTIKVEKANIDELIEAEGETEISLSMDAGTMILTAIIESEVDLSAGGDWNWKSSDESVATVTPNEGEPVLKGRATVTAKGAGTAEITATYTSDNYTGSISYTLTVTEPEPEPEEPDTPVTPDYPDYYNIYVEECEGVTVETSTNVVREGNSMSFTIEVAEGYTAEDMVVKVKRSLFGYTDIIEPNEEGKYEIRNIYTEIYITVEGVEKETPTGIEEITGVKVYTKDGSLYVQTPKQEQVVIISISGAVIKNETQIGLKRYDLPRGIYIVRVGTQNYKIRN